MATRPWIYRLSVSLKLLVSCGLRCCKKMCRSMSEFKKPFYCLSQVAYRDHFCHLPIHLSIPLSITLFLTLDWFPYVSWTTLLSKMQKVFLNTSMGLWVRFVFVFYEKQLVSHSCQYTEKYFCAFFKFSLVLTKTCNNFAVTKWLIWILI